MKLVYNYRIAAWLFSKHNIIFGGLIQKHENAVPRKLVYICIEAIYCRGVVIWTTRSILENKILSENLVPRITHYTVYTLAFSLTA